MCIFKVHEEDGSKNNKDVELYDKINGKFVLIWDGS